VKDRFYVKVYEARRKRPCLEFQAETPDEVIKEVCWWLRRAYPEVFRAVISGAEFKPRETG